MMIQRNQVVFAPIRPLRFLICRSLHSNRPLQSLFGGGSHNGRGPSSSSTSGQTSSIFRSDPSDTSSLFKPSTKSKPPVNPADILKQNDILLYLSKPLNYIESIKLNGFHLANNYLVTSPDLQGNVVGLCLIGSETFEVNFQHGDKSLVKIDGHVVTFAKEVFQIFNKVHPKPELVVVGLGKTSRILSPENRNWFSELGILLEVSDSNNSGQIFDLLSTERPGIIGALLLPPNV